MSQYTSQYGDQFLQGLLTGQKLRQFQLDYKTAMVQKQLLEQDLQHRSTMQPLTKTYQELLNTNAQLDQEHKTLANQLAQETYGDSVAESKGRAGEAGARARLYSADADVAEATKGSRISTVKSGADQARAGAIKAQLDTLSSGNVQFTPQDLENFLDMNGVVDEKGTRDVFGKMVMGQLATKQQELAQALQTSKAIQQHNETQANSLKGQAFYQIVQGGGVLSDLASQAPESYRAGRPVFEKEFGPAAVALADMSVESARRRTAATASDTVVTENPFEKTVQTKAADSYAGLRDQLMAAKRLKTELESGRPLTSEEATFWNLDSTDRKNRIAETASKIEALQSQMDELKSSSEPVSKTTKKSKGGDTTELKSVQATLDGFNVSLDPNASDDDLKALSAALAKRGRKVSFENLQALRNSLR